MFFRVEFAKGDELRDFNNGGFGGGRHDRAEVARRFTVDRVAPAVSPVGLNQGEVSFNRILKHIMAAIYFPGFFAFRQRRAVAGWGKDRAEPRASGPGSAPPDCPAAPVPAQPCRGDRGHQKLVNPPGAGMSRSFCAPARLLSSAASPTSPLPALLLIMVRVAGALFNQGINQIRRLPGGAKTANHDGRAVVDPGNGLTQRRHAFYQSSGRSLNVR